MLLHKMYVYLFIIVYSIQSLGMETDSTYSVFLYFNEIDCQEIKINDHILNNSDFFVSQKLFSNNSNKPIKLRFDNLAKDDPIIPVLTESLLKEYNVKEYFNFFQQNSIDDLLQLYTQYNYLGYKKIENIICAAIIVRAHNDDLVKYKEFIQFTKPQEAVTKNSYSNNLYQSDDYQTTYNKQFINTLIQNQPFYPDSFDEDIYNLLHFCNKLERKKIITEDILKKITIENRKIGTENINNQYKELYKELRNIIFQNLKEPEKIKFLCLTDMTINTQTYATKLSKPFSKNFTNIIFHNVNFITFGGFFMHLLLHWREQSTQSLNVYITGANTSITTETKEPAKSPYPPLAYELLRGIYYKKSEHSRNLLVPGKLFIGSDVSKKLQKELQPNSIYYTEWYYAYQEIKKLLKASDEFAIFNILTACIGDILLSFVYNISIERIYSWDHFLVPIPLLLLTVNFFLNSIGGSCSCCNGEDELPQKEKNRIHQERANAFKYFCVCFGLIVTFYIYKEIKYKPSGWHTYSFFPWLLIPVQAGLMYLCATKNKNNYQDIKHGKVELIEDISTVHP